jgi:23S rRNA pseudouridine1911/1915/1917 synthase
MVNEELAPQENDDLLLENGDASEELYVRRNIVVDKGQDLLRIDKFLMTRIEGATRNKIQQGIEAGLVLVNNQPVKSNYKVRPADQIVLYSETNPESTDIVPEDLPLEIIYEDEDVMVLNKPAGIVVHPGCGNYSGTLINGVAFHLQQQNPTVTEDLLPRFGLVHRIDKNTSGLLVLAKNEKASAHLAKQFFDHTVDRKYIALVWGDFTEEEGTINAHVGRHQRFRKIMSAYPDGDYGKEAITHFRVLEHFHYVSLVECQLETGRTHQIRVHMQLIGHPLFNDDTYGGDRIVKGTIYTKYKQFVDNCFAICPRHALHARTLGFTHPSTKERMFFESPLPSDMEQLINKWRNYAAYKGAPEA